MISISDKIKKLLYTLLALWLIVFICKVVGILPFTAWWIILFPIWFPITFIIVLGVIVFAFLKHHKIF